MPLIHMKCTIMPSPIDLEVLLEVSRDPQILARPWKLYHQSYKSPFNFGVYAFRFISSSPRTHQ